MCLIVDGGWQLVPAVINAGVMSLSLILWANGLRNCGPVRYVNYFLFLAICIVFHFFQGLGIHMSITTTLATKLLANELLLEWQDHIRRVCWCSTRGNLNSAVQSKWYCLETSELSHLLMFIEFLECISVINAKCN